MSAWMEVLPWFVGSLGAACLCAVGGFVIGIVWGINFSTARTTRDGANDPPQPLLTPELWTPERMARAVAAQNPPRHPETPRPYAMPGLDD